MFHRVELSVGKFCGVLQLLCSYLELTASVYEGLTGFPWKTSSPKGLPYFRFRSFRAVFTGSPSLLLGFYRPSLWRVSVLSDLVEFAFYLGVFSFIFFFFFFFPSVSFRFRRSPLITKGNGEALWSSGDRYNCRRHYLTAIVPSPALFDPSSRLSTSDRFFLLLLLTKRSVVSAFIVERPALQDVSVSEFFFLLELKKNTENCLAPRKSDFTLVRTRVPTSLEELDVAVKHWPTFINVKSFERSSVRCSYWSNDGCCSM